MKLLNQGDFFRFGHAKLPYGPDIEFFSLVFFLLWHINHSDHL
jgi:hypothetical protein